MSASHPSRRHAPDATPSFPALIRRLMAAVRAEQPKPGPGAALMQFLRASRLVLFRQEYREFLKLRHRDASCKDSAPQFLACLRYRHYLSRRLTLRQRVAGLLHHERYEGSRCDDGYRKAIAGGDGLELWGEVVDGVGYSIRLVAAQDNSIEGQRSVVLFVGAQRICVMSFSYVDAEVFGLPSEPMLFITRNQSDAGSPEKTLFVRAFKQNMPSYFCLAAISGIALAQGMTRIAAVKARAHVAFEARHARSFDHSYGSFWDSFQGHVVDDHVALLPVPLELPPIDTVSAKHRSRARARRLHWQEIRRSAWAATHALLRPDAPNATAPSEPTVHHAAAAR